MHCQPEAWSSTQSSRQLWGLGKKQVLATALKREKPAMGQGDEPTPGPPARVDLGT